MAGVIASFCVGARRYCFEMRWVATGMGTTEMIEPVGPCYGRVDQSLPYIPMRQDTRLLVFSVVDDRILPLTPCIIGERPTPLVLIDGHFDTEASYDR